MLKRLTDKVQRIRYLTLNIENRLEESITEHSQIVDFIIHNDVEGALHALTTHFTEVKKGLKKLFADPNQNFWGRAFITTDSS